jgi:hypothetical protein
VVAGGVLRIRGYGAVENLIAQYSGTFSWKKISGIDGIRGMTTQDHERLDGLLVDPSDPEDPGIKVF